MEIKTKFLEHAKLLGSIDIYHSTSALDVPLLFPFEHIFWETVLYTDSSYL